MEIFLFLIGCVIFSAFTVIIRFCGKNIETMNPLAVSCSVCIFVSTLPGIMLGFGENISTASFYDVLCVSAFVFMFFYFTSLNFLISWKVRRDEKSKIIGSRNSGILNGAVLVCALNALGSFYILIIHMINVVDYITKHSDAFSLYFIFFFVELLIVPLVIYICLKGVTRVFPGEEEYDYIEDL